MDVERIVIVPGDPTPVTVSIENGLATEVRYLAYALAPYAWNGETAGLSLVHIYRDSQPQGMFVSRPQVLPLLPVQGMASYPAPFSVVIR